VSRRLVLLASTAVAAVLLVPAFNGAVTYYQEPSELVAAHLSGDQVRVGGLVVDGSLRRDHGDVEFELADAGASVRVLYDGEPTGSFREGQGAVVEGRYDGEVLVATRVMVQHSNEYRAPTTERP
jgi:cytochrome c-type biogenesis protein CcmE